MCDDGQIMLIIIEFKFYRQCFGVHLIHRFMTFTMTLFPAYPYTLFIYLMMHRTRMLLLSLCLCLYFFPPIVATFFFSRRSMTSLARVFVISAHPMGIFNACVYCFMWDLTPTFLMLHNIGHLISSHNIPSKIRWLPSIFTTIESLCLALCHRNCILNSYCWFYNPKHHHKAY